MIRCILCREPFAICAVTYEVEGGELCEGCDATFAEPIRPSLGGAVAFLKRADERREPDYLADGEWRWYDARTEAAFLPLALRQCSPQWPAHITARHPRAVDRRTGPRSESYFARLAE